MSTQTWSSDPLPLAATLLSPGPGQRRDDIALPTAPAGADGYCDPVLDHNAPIDPRAVYWTPNPCRRKGRSARRRRENLETLACIGLDIDFEGKGDDKDRMVTRVLQALLAIRVPEPSWWLFSGCGLWAFWLLAHPDRTDVPHALMPNRDPAREAAMIHYKDVARRLVEEVGKQGLPSDKRCVDPTRLSRIPGTVNSKSGRGVEWLAVDMSTRRTLDSLGRALYGQNWQAVPVSDLYLRSRTLLLPSQVQSDSRAHEAAARARRPMRTRLEALERLVRRHGGPLMGHRQRLILAYVGLAIRAGLGRRETRRRTLWLADQCRPPFDRGEAEAQIQWCFANARRVTTDAAGRRIPPVSNQTIADALGVPVAEVDEEGGGKYANRRNNHRRAKRGVTSGASSRIISKRTRLLRLLASQPHLADLPVRELASVASAKLEESVGRDSCSRAKREFERNRRAESPGDTDRPPAAASQEQAQQEEPALTAAGADDGSGVPL